MEQGIIGICKQPVNKCLLVQKTATGDGWCIKFINAYTLQGIVEVTTSLYGQTASESASFFEMILKGKHYSEHVRKPFTERQIEKHAKVFALRCQELAEAGDKK